MDEKLLEGETRGKCEPEGERNYRITEREWAVIIGGGGGRR